MRPCPADPEKPDRAADAAGKWRRRGEKLVAMKKQCTKCRHWKPLSAFYSDKNTSNGLTCWCKHCYGRYYNQRMEDPEYRALVNARARKLLSDPERRAHRNAWQREQRKDPERRARMNTKSRERRKNDPKHRARLNAQAREWRVKDPKRLARMNAQAMKQEREKWTNPKHRACKNTRQRELRRKKRAEDPIAYHERTFENRRRRRALEANAPLGCCPRGLRAMRIAVQGGLCYSCGEPLGTRAHLDHIKPLRYGGAEDVRNLAMQCNHCGDSKGSQVVAEWMKWKHPGRRWGEIKRELDRQARFIKQHHALPLQEFKRAWKGEN